MIDVICRRADSVGDFDACMRIRELVFIGEQKVPVALERDGMDNNCLHFVAIVENETVATARVMILDDRFKFQRVAVLPAARRKGVGSTLMKYMMAELSERDDAAGKQFFLSSQVDAMVFYAQLGFDICSEEYMDAGIQHRDMQRKI